MKTHNQNLFHLVEAVLRSYAYVSQHMSSLGASIGIINALLLNGNVSLGSIQGSQTNYSARDFQSNGLVNDLLLKWNACNVCIISDIMARTIKLNVEVIRILLLRLYILFY
jgi:hypothetical protein